MELKKKTRQKIPGKWLACVSLVSILTVGVANAHQSLFPHTHPPVNYSQITGVEFNTPLQAWQSISPNRRALTTRIPPSSTILADSPELRVNITISVTSGSGITPDTMGAELATNDDAFPDSVLGNNTVTCSGGYASPYGSTHSTNCSMHHVFAATLTDSITIPLRVKQKNSNTFHNLTWTIVPTAPGPYVASLNTPNTTKGYTTTMRVTLTANAPAGGTTVHWKMIPGTCFSQAANSVPYGPSGYNNFSVPEGDLWKDISVIANSSCDSALLRTWVERINTEDDPYFVWKSFLVKNPPLNPRPNRPSLPSKGLKQEQIEGMPSKSPMKNVAPTSASSIQVVGANVRSVTVQRSRATTITLKGRNLHKLKAARVVQGGTPYPGMSATIIKGKHGMQVQISASRNTRPAKNLNLEVSDGRRNYRVPVPVQVR